MRRLAFALAPLLACAAPGDTDDHLAEEGTTMLADAGTTGSSSSGASTGVADESSDSGPAPPDGILECTETCTVPFDCCLPGTPGCPGVYPYNFACKDGICVPGHCDGDDDCTVEGERCHVVRGVPRCVMPCESDPECEQPNTAATCVGTTDDGIAICFERCDAPGVFCGNETCDVDSGLCVCTSSGQCQFNEECVD